MQAVAQHRDRQAFAEIFDHFAPRLETYLQRLGLSKDAAEDITQEVMTTLWVKSALFDAGKSSLSTWIYRIARNRRIDHARRSREATSFDDSGLSETLASEEPGADHTMGAGQEAKALHGALRELPVEQRALVELSYFEGLSQSEIAERAQLPLGTVKSRLRLAFNRLRQSMARCGIEGTA